MNYNKFTFEDIKYVIFDPKGQKICQVKMRGQIFPSKEMKKNIWNKRLGNFHHRTLFYILNKDIVQGLPLMEESNTQLATHVNWKSKVGCLLPRQTGEQ